MDRKELKAFLDQKYLEYNRPDFIEPDPISIPHRFDRKEDREVAGLLTSIISWGRRDMIVRSARRLMEMMGEEPYRFVMEATEGDLEILHEFVYRTFQGPDCYHLVKGLRRVYQDVGGLEALMFMPREAKDTRLAIIQLRNFLLAAPDFPRRTHKHIANPDKGSSAKRLNMFLRWMVRKDSAGVDFGIWKSINSSQLICPLDVHTGNVGRKLGILTRKQNDWKAALEMTAVLRSMDPKDPVKYDFSLFGLGIFEGF